MRKTYYFTGNGINAIYQEMVMEQWTAEYFVSHGTKLHYYRTGGARLPLVLMHGITDDSLCWTPVAEALAEKYDVIMVDARGHGKSDAPENGYDYETMATEVAGLIEGLALENPVVIGHSLGAMTTLMLASLYPDLPRAIILEDPPVFWCVGPLSQEDLDVRAGMRAWFYEVKRKTRDELLEAVRIENPGWSEAELGPWADAKHRFSLEITRMLNPQETIPANFPELLKQVICPALLITADPERGAILTDEDVAELQKSVPHLKRVHIPGAGHNIRREQFSRYMNVVEMFLNKI
jgi:N-formylmaleamate deformylase